MPTSNQPADRRLEQALALLRTIISEMGVGDEAPSVSGPHAPWEQEWQVANRFPGGGGRADRRLSATDSLSWWFRPAGHGASAWDDYFRRDGGRESNAVPPPHALPPQAPPALELPPATGAGTPGMGAPARPPAAPPAISSWMGLRLLLAEPEEELLDEEADSVIECLYAFIHAVGRRDVDAAMRCVADDFHTLEDDRELDRDGLEGKLRFMLGSLRDWEFDIALVEIPQPILHPDGILVYTETLIDAVHPEDRRRRSIRERRIAFFTRQADGARRAGGNWLLAAFPSVGESDA